MSRVVSKGVRRSLAVAATWLHSRTLSKLSNTSFSNNFSTPYHAPHEPVAWRKAPVLPAGRATQALKGHRREGIFSRCSCGVLLTTGMSGICSSHKFARSLSTDSRQDLGFVGLRQTRRSSGIHNVFVLIVKVSSRDLRGRRAAGGCIHLSFRLGR